MSNRPVVKLEDERPARQGSGVCFYCNNKIGELHGDECPLWTKNMLVKAQITYKVEVPHYWDKERLEFHRNESSWCAGNMIQELERLDEESGCLCEYVNYEAIE